MFLSRCTVAPRGLSQAFHVLHASAEKSQPGLQGIQRKEGLGLSIAGALAYEQSGVPFALLAGTCHFPGLADRCRTCFHFCARSCIALRNSRSFSSNARSLSIAACSTASPQLDLPFKRPCAFMKHTATSLAPCLAICGGQRRGLSCCQPF